MRRHVKLLGLVSDADKPRLFRTADVYGAPNTGQESFGIVLLEAMAARHAVVASDIDAFRRVLDDGRAGRLFANGDPADLARVSIEVLTLARPAPRNSPKRAGRPCSSTTGRPSPPRSSTSTKP